MKWLVSVHERNAGWAAFAPDNNYDQKIFHCFETRTAPLDGRCRQLITETTK